MSIRNFTAWLIQRFRLVNIKRNESITKLIKLLGNGQCPLIDISRGAYSGLHNSKNRKYLNKCAANLSIGNFRMTDKSLPKSKFQHFYFFAFFSPGHFTFISILLPLFCLFFPVETWNKRVSSAIKGREAGQESSIKDKERAFVMLFPIVHSTMKLSQFDDWISWNWDDVSSLTCRWKVDGYEKQALVWEVSWASFCQDDRNMEISSSMTMNSNITQLGSNYMTTFIRARRRHVNFPGTCHEYSLFLFFEVKKKKVRATEMAKAKKGISCPFHFHKNYPMYPARALPC